MPQAPERSRFDGMSVRDQHLAVTRIVLRPIGTRSPWVPRLLTAALAMLVPAAAGANEAAAAGVTGLASPEAGVRQQL